jgi:predicted aspartyl protease
MGRFSVQFVVANNRDVILAKSGDVIPDSVKHLTLSGVVDSGAARLVLPQRVASELHLQDDGETTVRCADHRREKRQLVSNVWLQMSGRHGVFSAVVEPSRDDALIGAIVLEELDLIVDCGTQSVHPREPDAIVTEIDFHNGDVPQ